MKKIIMTISALSLIAAILFTFTACGEQKSDSKSEDKNSDAAPAVTEAPTEAPTEGLDTEAVKAEMQEQIVGNWTFYNWMQKVTSNHLVFNADGTGSYQGGVVENGNYEYDYTFTYTITVEPNEYRPDLPKSTLHVKYNEVNETEDRGLSFIEGKLMLSYGDNWIIQYDEYTREEDVPKE